MAAILFSGNPTSNHWIHLCMCVYVCASVSVCVPVYRNCLRTCVALTKSHITPTQPNVHPFTSPSPFYTTLLHPPSHMNIGLMVKIYQHTFIRIYLRVLLSILIHTCVRVYVCVCERVLYSECMYGWMCEHVGLYHKRKKNHSTNSQN